MRDNLRVLLTFLFRRDEKLLRRPLLILLILLPVEKLILYVPGLAQGIHDLYEWEYRADGTRYRVLGELSMTPLSQLLDVSYNLSVLLFFVAMVLALLLPALQDQDGGKSLRTLMRLPLSRGWFYGYRLMLPAVVGWCFWLVNGVTALFCGILYRLFVPAARLPADWWSSLWESQQMLCWMPMLEPARWAAALCLPLLVGAAGMLLVLTFQGRSLLAVAGGIVGVAGVVYFLLSDGLMVWLGIPLLTCLLCGLGWYLICRRCSF